MGDPQQAPQIGWAPSIEEGLAPAPGYGAPYAYPPPGEVPMPMPVPVGYPASPGHHEGAPMLPPGNPAKPAEPAEPNNPPGGVDPEAPSPIVAPFTDPATRIKFVRKLFAILSVQLLATLGLIALCLFEYSVYRIASRLETLIAVCGIHAIFALSLACCCGNLRRKKPFILLLLFTITQGLMLGVISTFNKMDQVFFAVAISTIACFCIIFYCLPCGFTMCFGSLFVFLMILIIYGLLTTFNRHYMLHLLYSAAGALLFCIYLIFDAQTMIRGKHKYNSISPDECLFAALSVYVDVLHLPMRILTICAPSKKN